MTSAPTSSQFKLPALGFPSGSPGGGFVLPKLGNFPPSGSNCPLGQGSCLSLSDYASAQLKNLPTGTTKSSFTIPKIFPTKSEVPTDEMMNLHVSNEPPKVFIDLKSALVPKTEQKKISSAPKKEVENFIPKFVDCDSRVESQKELTIDECCERVTLKELASRFKNCSFKKFSAVGRIIKRKFTVKAPKIRHGYETKHQINRFAFDTPSPDDKILAHLNKNKK